MGERWLKVLFACLGAVMCVALMRLLLPAPAGAPRGISVRFVLFTNTASGAVAAQFALSNSYPHGLVVAGGAVQVRQSKGWPHVPVYGNQVGPVFTVAPKSEHVFAVVLSNVDGAVWRVPLAYQRADTRFERLTAPLTAALGFDPDRTCRFTNTPEMLGISNHASTRPSPAAW